MISEMVQIVSQKDTQFTVYPALEQSSKVVWRLPGWKERGNELCGVVVGVKACEKHLKGRQLLYHRCFNPECSICCKAWNGRASGRIEKRLGKVKDVYYEAGVRLGNVRHFVLSPPQEWGIKLMNTVEGVKELRGEAQKLLKRIGFKGGCMIFHSYRVDGLVWYYSPHFHVVGFGYLLGADKVFKETGWVYKNKGVRRSLFGTVNYLLGHCGLGYVDGVRRFHADTWFGIAGYNKMVKISEEKRIVYENCKVCGEPLHRFSVYGCRKEDYSDNENWVDEGYYTKVEIVREYRIKGYREKRFLQKRLDGG